MAELLYERMAATVRRLTAILVMGMGLSILAVPLVSLLSILSLYVATRDVSSAAEGDALVTGCVNYTIRDVMDDGTGMTTLMLEAD